MRLTKRAPITTAGTMPIIIVRIIIIKRMTIMERILVALEYKKGGKDGCYRFY